MTSLPPDRAEAERDFHPCAVRVLAAAVRQDPGILHGALPTALPWVRFLPPAQAHRFAAEFGATVVAAAALGDSAPISRLMATWQHTAAAYPDPDLLRLLAAELDAADPGHEQRSS